MNVTMGDVEYTYTTIIREDECAAVQSVLNRVFRRASRFSDTRVSATYSEPEEGMCTVQVVWRIERVVIDDRNDRDCFRTVVLGELNDVFKRHLLLSFEERAIKTE